VGGSNRVHHGEEEAQNLEEERGKNLWEVRLVPGNIYKSEVRKDESKERFVRLPNDIRVGFAPVGVSDSVHLCS
jgi:hypothetical protein